eukprot:gene26197-biopygen2736
MWSIPRFPTLRLGPFYSHGFTVPHLRDGRGAVVALKMDYDAHNPRNVFVTCSYRKKNSEERLPPYAFKIENDDGLILRILGILSEKIEPYPQNDVFLREQISLRSPKKRYAGPLGDP